MAKQDNQAQQQAELLRIATNIAINGKRVGEIHRLLDSFTQHGSQPVNEKAVLFASPDEMSRGDLARTLINLPPTLSKARKKLLTLTPDSDEAKLLTQNIMVWTEQLTRARAIAKEQ